MKHFAKYMSKIPAEYLPRIEQSITRAAQVIGDPNSTSESYDAITRELAVIQKALGKGAAEAWQGEVAERLKATWIEAGRDGIELQRQVMPKITNVMKSAEKLRKPLQLSAWGAVAGKLAIGLGVVAGLWAINGVGTRQDSRPMQQESENGRLQPVLKIPDEVPDSSVENKRLADEKEMENTIGRLREFTPDKPWAPSMDELIAFQAKLAELKKLPPNPAARPARVTTVTPAEPVIEPAPYQPVVPDRNSTSPPTIGCFWQDVSPYGPPIRACPVD
ncbi:MAG TPA: hypothetical protein VF544_16940 [Pyrinomonadaceae bacterium]|jgi:hypothetical protein